MICLTQNLLIVDIFKSVPIDIKIFKNVFLRSGKICLLIYCQFALKISSIKICRLGHFLWNFRRTTSFSATTAPVVLLAVSRFALPVRIVTMGKMSVSEWTVLKTIVSQVSLTSMVYGLLPYDNSSCIVKWRAQRRGRVPLQAMASV